MPEIFPAPAGTFVVHREQGSTTTVKTPVIGFMFVQQGPVFPLCVMPFGGLTTGKALLHDSGFVSDPAAGLVFGTLTEWEHVVDSKGYWAKKPEPAKTAKPTTDEKLADAGKRLGIDEAGKPATDFAETRSDQREHYAKSGGVEGVIARAKVIPDKPVRNRKPRIFETNSWWMFPADDNAVARRIWMTPSGEVVPFEDDPDYTKIKGTEFNALKKDGWTVGDPREEAPAAEDDEDDGKSLI